MGSKNYERVKKTWIKAAIVAVSICMFVFAAFQLMPRAIISVFGDGTELYFQFAELYLRKYMFMVGLLCLQPFSTNYFSATGQYKTGLFISLSRQGFLLLPLLNILPRFMGIDGILYAGPIADGIAVCITLFCVFRSFKKMEASKVHS